MAKRMFLMLGVVVVLLSALGFMKFKQVQTAVQASAFQPPPEAVTSVVAKREQWPSTTAVIGTMEAVHGVMVSADLPGTVVKINFESGKAVREGDILVELDTSQERAQVASLEAQRDLAKVKPPVPAPGWYRSTRMSGFSHQLKVISARLAWAVTP